MTTLRPLTEEETTYFQAWRATALHIMPYMSSLMFNFKPVHTDAVDTFAVDPELRLYINMDNCIPKGARFCGEGMLHEAGHIWSEHSVLAELDNVKSEEARDWNLAADMALNDDLRDAGCSELAAHGVFAANIDEPDYLTPLHYMDKIRRMRQAQKDKDARSPKPRQDPSDTPHKGCGSGSGGVKADFELGANDLDGAAQPASAVEKHLIMIATHAAVKKHQDQHGQGSVPAGLVASLEEILKPADTPWERVLGGHIRRCVVYRAGFAEETYSRRNRRRMHETLRTPQGRVVGKVIAPGTVKPIPSVHFYRDTSFSIPESDLSMITGEVVSIARKMGIRGDNLVITDVDATIHKSVKFSGARELSEVEGRGGTNMCKAIEHSCSLRKKPSVIVIATDGETPWPVERPAIPVVVLLVNVTNPTYVNKVPEWAHLVQIGETPS